jgi:tetratricopeptide (TPR) repeat protein
MCSAGSSARHGNQTGTRRRPFAAKTAASHTYDHFKERWESFDVEAALAEVDQDDLPQPVAHQNHEEANESAVCSPTAADTSWCFFGSMSTLTNAARQLQDEVPIRQPRTPAEARDFWKDKGNQYFKVGDFQKAKECYSSSLVAQYSAAACMNHALACLKLKEWQQAEDDCSRVRITRSSSVTRDGRFRV